MKLSPTLEKASSAQITLESEASIGYRHDGPGLLRLADELGQRPVATTENPAN